MTDNTSLLEPADQGCGVRGTAARQHQRRQNLDVGHRTTGSRHPLERPAHSSPTADEQHRALRVVGSGCGQRGRDRVELFHRRNVAKGEDTPARASSTTAGTVSAMSCFRRFRARMTPQTHGHGTTRSGTVGSPRRIALGVASVVLVGAVSQACGSSETSEAVTSGAAPAATADDNAAAPAVAGNDNAAAPAAANDNAAAQGEPLGAAPSAALSWSGVDLEGNEVNGGSYTGKDAVLWFWAPWCEVCNEEAPGVSALARQYGDRVTFVGIAAHDDVAAMREFVKKYGLTFTNLNDSKATIWAKLGIPGQPSAYFIDGETGAAVGPVIGVTAEGMEIQISALLN